MPQSPLESSAFIVEQLSMYLHISERRLQRRFVRYRRTKKPLHRCIHAIGYDKALRHRLYSEQVLPPVLPTALIRLTTVPIRRRRPRAPRSTAFRLTLGPNAPLRRWKSP